jgi:uncharacterized protein with GYD domain
MPFFLMRWKYTPESWEILMDDPVDRREGTRAGLAELGATLHGYWYSFGPHDGYMLVEAPDNVTPAGIRPLDVGVGLVQDMETIVLIEVEEMLESLKRVAYQREKIRPPKKGGAESA